MSEVSYIIQYLAPDGEWRTDEYLSHICSPANIEWLRRSPTFWKTDEQCVESNAKTASLAPKYKNTPIRTLYGESLSPVSVYVNGYNVRDAWVDKDLGHPHLQVTVLCLPWCY